MRLTALFISLIKKGIHYGLIGLSGVGVNLLVFHFSLYMLHGTPTESNIAAIIVSMSSNFAIALKTRLFESMPNSVSPWAWVTKKAVHYFAVSGSGSVINAISFQIMIRFIHVTPAWWANLLAIVIGMASNYTIAVTTKLVPIEFEASPRDSSRLAQMRE